MYNPDLLPCPVCGFVMGRTRLTSDSTSIKDDPALTTPLQRLSALATAADISVFDISPKGIANLGSIITPGFNTEGTLTWEVYIASDLNDNLHAEILAFSLVTVAEFDELGTDTTNIYTGVLRDRLLAAKTGPGHVAWHILRSCGHNSTSATFGVVSFSDTAEPV
jgi:hypothetical protein